MSESFLNRRLKSVISGEVRSPGQGSVSWRSSRAGGVVAMSSNSGSDALTTNKPGVFHPRTKTPGVDAIHKLDGER